MGRKEKNKMVPISLVYHRTHQTPSRKTPKITAYRVSVRYFALLNWAPGIDSNSHYTQSEHLSHRTVSYYETWSLVVHAFPMCFVAARPEAEDDTSSEEEEEEGGEIPNERRSASASDDDSTINSRLRNRLRFTFVDSHLLPTIATVRTFVTGVGVLSACSLQRPSSGASACGGKVFHDSDVLK